MMNISSPKSLRPPINTQSINHHAQKTYTNSNIIKISAIWRHHGKILNIQNLGRWTNFEEWTTYNVVHWVDLLMPIEPNFVCSIIPRFVDLDECATNQPNAKLKHGGAQHKFPLWSGLSDLIPNCIIDARCNENGVITNFTFWSIP